MSVSKALFDVRVPAMDDLYTSVRMPFGISYGCYVLYCTDAFCNIVWMLLCWCRR